MAPNKKLLVVLSLILACLFSATARATSVNSEIAMPEEYIAYTVTSVSGDLWAKIDGTYPLQILFKPEQMTAPLKLVYPTPPGTTNITIAVDDKEIAWNNYTEIYPSALHATALGDWSMVNCTIYPVPEQFTLKIHYEHPIQLINGSYTFLYDLNISPYLSPSSPKSTAYFKIRMETYYTSLHVNTISSDGVLNPVNHTIEKDGETETITLQIVSEYQKPLLGDILITFAAANAPDALEFLYPVIIVLVAVIATLIIRVTYGRKHAGNRGSSTSR